MGIVNDIVLYLEVGIDKIRWVCLIGDDTSNFCGGEKDILGFFLFKKFLYGELVAEVKFLFCSEDKIVVAFFLQKADDT